MKTTINQLFEDEEKKIIWLKANCNVCLKSTVLDSSNYYNVNFKCAIFRDITAQKEGFIEVSNYSFNMCKKEKCTKIQETKKPKPYKKIKNQTLILF